MISIGGIPDQDQLPANWFDPWTNGMQIFDMTELFWTDTYNANAAEYEPPDVVKQFYSTNSRYPASWVDPRLADIFQSSTASSKNTTNTSNSTSASHTSSTGAIAGGVVGGIAFLSLIAAGLLILLKRKRRHQFTVASSSWKLGSDKMVVEADTTEKKVVAELYVQEQPRHELETIPSELEGESTFVAQPDDRAR